MVTVHLLVGVSVLGANLIAGVWGGLAWYLRRPTVGFWYALRTAQVAVVVQVALGGLLLLQGHQVADELHYVYGALPVLVALLGEGARMLATEHELEGLDFDALPASRRRAVAAAITRREPGISPPFESPAALSRRCGPAWATTMCVPP
jgi:hypothetical protein